MIRKVRDEGISILVIEHVIKAIKSLSDRLLVLHHGEKIAEGEPEARAREPGRDRGLSRQEADMNASRQSKRILCLTSQRSAPATAECRFCTTSL